MSSKPAGIPEDAVQTADWKIPIGATHYVGPLPTSDEYNGDDNWDHPDVQFYKVRQACGDPSKQAFCPWNSYKLLFMYGESQPPNLLPLPDVVVESHHVTSSYFAVVNGVLRRFQLLQELTQTPVQATRNLQAGFDRGTVEVPSSVKMDAPPNPPHRWSKEIKAWADGHIIQMRNKTRNSFRDEDDPDEFHYSAWIDQKNPGWWYESEVTEYRVKPNVEVK